MPPGRRRDGAGGRGRIRRSVSIIAEVLRELGYACIEAGDGQMALPVLASNTRLDLMITDVGLAGPERTAARGDRAATSAGSEDSVRHRLRRARDRQAPFLAPGMEMVTKPFTLDALALKIREMLRR